MMCQAIDHIALDQDAGDRRDSGLKGFTTSYRMAGVVSEKLVTKRMKQRLLKTQRYCDLRLVIITFHIMYKETV